MEIVNNIRSLCKEKGIPISKIEKDLGYGNGYFNPKKLKSIPSDRLVEIAEYLNMSVNELLECESGSILGKNIRFLRRNAGLSQDELAEQLGYTSFTTVQKWESGVSDPPISVVMKLSDLFHVDLDALTKEDLETTAETQKKKAINNDDLKAFGTRLRYLRELKGLTLQEMAEKTGYTSRSTISKIEKGKVDVPQSKIKAFSEALGVSQEVLLGASENDTSEEERQRAIFSKNLNRLLDLTEKSQKEVAEAIGVMPQTFNTWTQGIAIPRMGKLQMLADYFQIPKAALLEDPSTGKKFFGKKTALLAQKIEGNKELRKLFEAAADADPEDIRVIYRVLTALKNKGS